MNQEWATRGERSKEWLRRPEEEEGEEDVPAGIAFEDVVGEDREAERLVGNGDIEDECLVEGMLEVEGERG